MLVVTLVVMTERVKVRSGNADPLCVPVLSILRKEVMDVMKKMYQVPALKVFGTISQLTQGIKQLQAPSDGNYLGSLDNPLNGSCHCVCPTNNVP